MTVIAPEDFKSHVRLTGSENDEIVATILGAAEEAIAKRVGALTSTSATYTVPAVCTSVVLPHTPVIAVSDPTGCTVNSEAGVVRLSTGFSADQTITYTHGYAVLPADLKVAVLEMARHLWQSSQRAGKGGPVTAPLGGYALPAGVSELIEPYMSLGFA